MKQKPGWYPNTGIQHTRAVVALTVITACLEKFKPDPESEIAQHIKIITSMVDACAKKTQTRKLSAGARHDLNNCFDTLAPFADTSGERTDEQRFRQ